MTEEWLIWTTAKPKNDKELDEKVFISAEQMKQKIDRGDFIEIIGITKHNTKWV